MMQAIMLVQVMMQTMGDDGVRDKTLSIRCQKGSYFF
jgi:hypothetical protein